MSCFIFKVLALPIVGAAKFLVRPYLWPQLIIPYLVSLVATILFLLLLFGFALHPQVQFLDQLGTPSWASYAIGIVLVLLETGILTLWIFVVLFGNVQYVITRRALEELGVIDRISANHNIRVLKELPCAMSAVHSCQFFMGRVPLMLLTLPLHSVPVIGQCAWQLCNGWLHAWELLSEFLPLVNLRSCGEQAGHVRQHFCTYASFGFLAMLFEMIPFVNIIFIAGNAYGAALLFESLYDRHAFDASIELYDSLLKKT